jgi:predicted dehydrogenase
MREIAVVGAGRWGVLHAHKLAALPGVRLAAIVDRNAARAAALAAAFPGALALAAPEALPSTVSAATVAVDLPALAPVAAALLERGLHVLVEKPAAPDAATAQALVALARQRARVLAVGFVERFNGALAALPPAGRRLVARRLGPPRPAAGPLHLDWLIHDLDLARFLLGPGLTVRRARTAEGDVRVRLAADDGREAVLRASWAARAARRLWLDGARADLLRDANDPLAAQLAAFVRALDGGDRGPLASGEDAVAALRLADDLAAGVGEVAA